MGQTLQGPNSRTQLSADAWEISFSLKNMSFVLVILSAAGYWDAGFQNQRLAAS